MGDEGLRGHWASGPLGRRGGRRARGIRRGTQDGERTAVKG